MKNVHVIQKVTAPVFIKDNLQMCLHNHELAATFPILRFGFCLQKFPMSSSWLETDR